MKTWRLLDTPPMTAAENMAMDETLLELKGQGKSPDTIRFLQFSPRASWWVSTRPLPRKSAWIIAGQTRLM